MPPRGSGWSAGISETRLGLSAADLLIDETTYTAWFGTNLDNHDTPAACPNITRQVTELSTP